MLPVSLSLEQLGNRRLEVMSAAAQINCGKEVGRKLNLLYPALSSILGLEGRAMSGHGSLK